MRVALVHDWLTGMRGGEKVLESLCELFPQASIFTLIHNKGSVSPLLESMPIETSFLQHLPFVKEKYRNYLPLFPWAIERFDLKGFDLIISSSHCVAKGVRKPKGAFHVCYCHTPMRYVWLFFEEYFGSFPFYKRWVIKALSIYLKHWDIATLDRVDEFVANSHTIQRRIREIYRRESVVIHPPVDVDSFDYDPQKPKGDFYICVSSMVPYKRIDIIIEAFNKMRDKKVVIVGDGHLRKALQKMSCSSNIIFRGWVRKEELRDLYQRAKAFVFAAEEDFGIAPIEAQAAGLPVIAYGKGGLSETVIPLDGEVQDVYPTGILFPRQENLSLIEAIEEFERRRGEFSPQKIRRHALKFSKEDFKRNIQKYMRERLKINL